MALQIENKNVENFKRKIKNGKLLISHRSTTYLCYVPILEE